MRNKLLAVLLCLGFLCSGFTARAAGSPYSDSVAGVQALSDGIVAYKGASTAQEWIDTGLCGTAGTTAEFYIITLSQSGNYNLSRYRSALLAYLDSHEVYSATTREKYALALLACGGTDDYIRRVCHSDIGAQGLMSLVFGLHLLNNGCSSGLYTVDSLIGAILAEQLSDGGWAVIGQNGDPDVTAMTMQALAPYYGARSGVTAAVDRALSLLSARQLESGGYKSMGQENCESAAQVLTALSCLGIDQSADSRFIKNGRTVLDAMTAYRNADGSFAHTVGGGFNESATQQAFYALRAYLRLMNGQGSLYLLDHRPSSSAWAAPSGRTDPAPATRPTSAPTAVPTSAPASAPVTTASPPSDPSSEPTAIPAAQAETAAQPSIPPPVGSSDTVITAEKGYAHPASRDEIASTPDEPAAKGGYKPYVILGIIGAAALVCLVLFVKKKRNVKHYLAVVILAGAAIAFILLTSFESAESYAQTEEKTNPAGTVTMSVSCAVLADEDKMPYGVPADGVILPETAFVIEEGETVYDLLLEASKRCAIQIDNRGSADSAYIAGIAYLYEYQYGELSGWMYRVNGTFPDVGCDAYTVSDGDRIEWLYTKNIGKDL